MPVEVMSSFENAFGAIVLEGYGLSETTPVASFNHPDRDANPARSAHRSRAWRCGSSTPGEKNVPGEVGEIAIGATTS